MGAQKDDRNFRRKGCHSGNFACMICAGIRAMPTFQTYLGGQKVGELTGADPRRLQQLVEE
eukprot:1148990-Pelagomonas_calceolata.AAC.2